MTSFSTFSLAFWIIFGLSLIRSLARHFLEVSPTSNFAKTPLNTGIKSLMRSLFSVWSKSLSTSLVNSRIVWLLLLMKLILTQMVWTIWLTFWTFWLVFFINQSNRPFCLIIDCRGVVIVAIFSIIFIIRVLIPWWWTSEQSWYAISIFGTKFCCNIPKSNSSLSPSWMTFKIHSKEKYNNSIEKYTNIKNIHVNNWYSDWVGYPKLRNGF